MKIFNNHKKLILGISSIVTLLFLFQGAFAAPGDIAGNVYSTDIVTYIYSAPITSYNIGGKTCIDAEILNWHYGFDVYWHENERHLEITDKGERFVSLQAMSGELVESKASNPREIVYNYIETDIITTLNGREIESYNIGGRTVICAETMRSFGYIVEWSEEKRTLTISTPMDFYKYETDFGTIKSMFDYRLDREQNVFLNRGVLIRVDEKDYMLNIPSNRIYTEPSGLSFIRLKDLESILGGECSMEEQTRTVVGISGEYEEYIYVFNLNYDTSVRPELTQYNAEEATMDFVTDSGYVVDLPINTLSINGEAHSISGMYGGKVFGSALLVAEGEIYIPAYILTELFGYEYVR